MHFKSIYTKRMLISLPDGTFSVSIWNTFINVHNWLGAIQNSMNSADSKNMSVRWSIRNSLRVPWETMNSNSFQCPVGSFLICSMKSRRDTSLIAINWIMYLNCTSGIKRLICHQRRCLPVLLKKIQLNYEKLPSIVLRIHNFHIDL